MAKKWTDATDDAWDKTHGIKEGSKRDLLLDKKRGVAEDDVTKRFQKHKKRRGM